MNEQAVKIDVVFRKFPKERETDRNEIIAFFPKEKADLKGNISSYMHVGQHSGADPMLIMTLSIPTYDEYEPLLQELISIGYEPNVLSGYELNQWLKENINIADLPLQF